jgi:hypothetical protein
MNTVKLFRSKITIAILLITLIASVVGVSLSASAAGTGPCDIYAAGGTPCVAAHSTVRALYGAYSGRLYQVRRASNGNTLDINTLSAGGFANSAAQDTFCAGTTCTISIIYDQSERGNHLTKASPGGFLTNGGLEANATAARIQVGGNWVYGVYTTMSWDNAAGSVGYRDNTTSGIATGDQPEGIYMVASGTRYNEWCCFDYGNADPSNTAAGEGTMEAVYFGDSTQWGYGSGSGPWVMADLEFGIFAGGALVNNNNTPIIANYITGMVKGNSGNSYAIKGGSAQSGSLKTMYNGARPTGYNPMRKGGAIVLGVGGDNSHTGEGTFFEGAMTSGYPSDATENAVQANIVAAGYGSSSGGPTPTAVRTNTPGPTPTASRTNTPGPTPTTGSFPVPGTYYRLINRNSGKVAEVANFSTADGGNVQQWSSTGTSSQQWRFVSVGSGYYNVINRNSGKCLDVNGVSTADGANVQQWTCGSGTNQRWQLIVVGSYYELKAQHSGKVLDVVGNGTADGVNVDQWTWNSGNNQQWQIIP